MESLNCSSRAIEEITAEPTDNSLQQNSDLQYKTQVIRCLLSSQANQLFEKLQQTKTQEISSMEMCSICYNMQVSIFEEPLVCGHIFHQDCIKQWFKVQQFCPLCHQTVQNYE